MAVWRVGERVRLRDIECVQHRALLIGGEQGGFDDVVLALLLRQELVLLLENRVLCRALKFGSQTVLQVKALMVRKVGRCAGHHAVEWIVVVLEEQGACRGHGVVPRKTGLLDMVWGC